MYEFLMWTLGITVKREEQVVLLVLQLHPLRTLNRKELKDASNTPITYSHKLTSLICNAEFTAWRQKFVALFPFIKK